MSTKNLALSAVMIALAMVLSYVENLIPFFVAVPGVKVGLANIVIMFVLYKVGTKNAFVISLFRVILSSLLFGTVLSFLYSVSGAIVSLTVMVMLKKTKLFSPVAVSVTGAVIHNLAQILVASLIVGTDVLKYYVPVLILSGVATGIVIGIISSTLIKRIDLD